MRLSIGAAVLTIVSAATALPAPAQLPVRALPTIGGDAEERARLAQLTDSARTDGFLLRRTAAALSWSDAAPRLQLLAPELAWTHNSRLPFSLNDGAVWAGRGSALRVSGGLVWSTARVRLVLAPEIVYAENRFVPLPDTLVTPWADSTRSPYANPWHVNPQSADLPLIMGAGAHTSLRAGQSSLTIALGAAEAGIATENQWWGPGVHNALVLSNNAGGFAHAFLRTARPLATKLGVFEAALLVGGLGESAHFDTIAGNDVRSLSAVAITWRADTAANLTLGLARGVFRAVDGWSGVPLRGLDALTSWRRPNDRADSTVTPGADQILSLFARWVLPRAGFEAWAEWGRAELPRSVRDLLLMPHHSQAYTLGFQWGRPVRGDGTLRLLGEVSWLERGASFRNRPTYAWYTSRAAVQGYTQQGQVLGAAIGPGSSSQMFSADWFAPRWRAGVVLGRIRWDNDTWFALGRTPPANVRNEWCSHDVSLLAGARGGWSAGWGRVMLSALAGFRWNTWFQNFDGCGVVFDDRGRLDRNTTLQVTITPGR